MLKILDAACKILRKAFYPEDCACRIKGCLVSDGGGGCVQVSSGIVFTVCSLIFSKGTVSSGNLCCNKIACSKPVCQFSTNPFHVDMLKPSAFDGLFPVVFMHIICALVHADL